MLTLRGVQAGYGQGLVVQGVDLDVPAGGLVAVLGRNGAGRSTLLRAVAGLLPAQGEIGLDGTDMAALPTHQRARHGLGYVPESRDIFTQLTVEDNLRMGYRAHSAAYWSLDRSYERFPLLAQRRRAPAGVLSGGEQQLLALARTLMGSPRCLLLDEPLEGLSPAMAQAIVQTLQWLKQQGGAVLLVEQKLATLHSGLVDRVAVLGQGRVVFAGTVDALTQAHDVRRQWLEI